MLRATTAVAEAGRRDPEPSARRWAPNEADHGRAAPPKREQVVRRQTGLPLLAQHDAVAAEEQPPVRMRLRQGTTRIVRGWSDEGPVLTRPD